ncbi:AAA family ATPase [Sphingomonas sp. NCPPB 2930]
MLQRLYIHNYRSFQNFELKVGDAHSSLLIGKNGAGKSSIARVLRIFQAIGRGDNRLKDLVNPREFFGGGSATPMRIEIETLVQGHSFRYALALELPERFKELRVMEERLERDGEPIYLREQAQVSLRRQDALPSADARFLVDWHLVALSIIQEHSTSDPIYIFKAWLARMVILAPVPDRMQSDSGDKTLWPETSAGNLADWLAGVLSQYPAAYSTISEYLLQVMPDLQDFLYEDLGQESRRLIVRFGLKGQGTLPLAFDQLSDGEKCFFLCSVIVAANRFYGPLLCFWDEPDNYLSLSEVSHFVMTLRRAFEGQGQILMTSHNEESIRRFSDENTWVIGRGSHMEPSQIRLLGELRERGERGESPPDVIQSLLLGEIQS